jgi:hypothetical protein
MANAGSKGTLRISLALDAALHAARAAAEQYVPLTALTQAPSAGKDAGSEPQIPAVPVACLERIALRHRFRLDEAAEPEADVEAQQRLRAQLLPYCLVVTEEGLRLWSLQLEARRAVLRALVGQSRLDRAVAQAKEANDEVARWAASLVSQTARPIAEQTAEELQKTLISTQWCDGIVGDLPGLAAVERRLALVRLLDPLARLIHRQDGPYGTVQPDAFVGRSAELSDLRTYVGVLPSGGWIDWRQIARSAGATLNRPFVITGLGGIGKSTLVAKFLIEHSSIDEAHRFPFVYLDFDRPGIVATEPVSLVIEMTRQLGWQFEALDRPLAQLRDELRKYTAADASPTSASPQSAVLDADALSYGIDRLCGIIRGAKLDDRPLLLVCDTFEEVQSRLGNGVERLAALIAQLSEQLSGMRTVIAGRDDHLGRLGKIHRALSLTELDDPSALKLVTSQGIDPATARDVIKTAGRSPLTLRLACQLVQQFGAEVIKSGRLDQLWQIFTRQAKDAYLYNRVLSHIDDPALRELANPGLLLRRITPDVVRQVMGPVRGKELSTEEAERIFEALRATGWLLEASLEGEALRHRTDLRRACIPLINNAEPELSKQLHTRAADFYLARQKDSEDAADRIEWAYHELALGRDIEGVDRQWDGKIAEGLNGAEGEIVGNGVAYLRARANQPLTPDELAALPERLWRERVQVAVSELLAAYRTEEAAQLLFSRGQALSDGATAILAATVSDCRGDWSVAAASWHAALGVKNDVATLLQAAEAAARMETGEVAAGLYGKAFGHSLAQQSDRIRASVGLVFCERLRLLEADGAWRTELPFDAIYSGNAAVVEAARFLESASSDWSVRQSDHETLRSLILLAPRSNRSDKLVIAALRSGELPWLTVAQIDALCDREQSFDMDVDRQWLADVAFADEEIEDVDIEDRGERGNALADWVEKYGLDAAELLRPYFRNPCPQWYVPMAGWLLQQTQQMTGLRTLLVRTQRRANATEFQGDPLAPSPDGSVRLLVLLLEILDRRGFLAPFLSTARELVGKTSPEFAARCSRFNLWLTALTGMAPLGPSPASDRHEIPARRSGGPPKKKAAARRLRR